MYFYRARYYSPTFRGSSRKTRWTSRCTLRFLGLRSGRKWLVRLLPGQRKPGRQRNYPRSRRGILGIHRRDGRQSARATYHGGQAMRQLFDPVDTSTGIFRHSRTDLYLCASSELDPREFVGGLDGLSIACGAWGCRPANHSWWPKAANPGPSPRCCWRGSPCAIKSPCWSAAELVARAFAVGIGCFGSCSRARGLNGAIA